MDEVYTYQKRDTKGMVRFRSEDDMWEYMTAHSGHHHHEYAGNRVYVEVSKRDEDRKRERAVRKVVRTLIETHGGDGPAVKEKMDALYKVGEVWFEDELVGEWQD
eukprot:10769626-Karenia_brevis.AAC.1